MEIYKNIKGYENYYQISNLGNVKTLARVVVRGSNHLTLSEKILKPAKNKNGYLTVVFRKDGKSKTFYIHQLMAITFLNHKPNGHKIVVDHINNNKLNNNINNLQLISHRENSIKDLKKGTSNYLGVTKIIKTKHFQAQINIKGTSKYLGNFKNEYDAHLAYQKALKELENDRKTVS